MHDDGTRTAGQFSEADPGTRPVPAGDVPAPNIPGYRIVRLLGEGGMGAVFEAQQEHPRRTVALKVIRAGFLGRGALRRFEVEAEALARLQHPGIAQVYAAGAADAAGGSQPWLAMELVRGRPIDAAADAAGLGERERLELVARVCDAVHHAHQKGVIHRDLKPANILLDESSQPKILDFGIARVTDSDVGATLQTTAGQIIGTLPYMSPEQVSGDPGEIDTRTDVYALGVILYQLLAGRLPIDLSRKSLPDAVRAIREDEPASISTVRRSLRGDVQSITARALEKEKARRYSSAAELAADIRHFLNDEPILARPPSSVYQLRKFARRHKALVAGTAAVFTVLALGAIVSTLQAVRATRAERLAQRQAAEAREARVLAETRGTEAEKQRGAAETARRAEAAERENAETAAASAREEEAKARAVNEFLGDMLRSASPYQTPGTPISVREMLDRAAQQIEAGSLRGSPAVEASVRQTLGETYSGLALYDSAELHLKQALRLRRAGVGTPAERSANLTGWAMLLRQTARFDEAAGAAQQAVDVARTVPGRDGERLLAEALSVVSDVHYRRSRYEEAEAAARSVLQLRAQLDGRDSARYASAAADLAFLLSERRKYAEAERHSREALAIRRRLLGPRHPDVCASLINLGRILSHEERFDEAEPLLREAVDLRRETFGSEHPETAVALLHLGWLYQDRSDPAAAEPFLQEALAIRRKVYGNDHVDVATALESLAHNADLRGDTAEYLRMAGEVLEIRKRALGPRSMAVASILQDIANALVSLGRPAEALPPITEAVSIVREVEGEHTPLAASYLAALGLVLQNTGDIDGAEKAYLEALELQRAGYGPRNSHVAARLRDLAVIHVRRGDLAGAERYGRESLDITRAVFSPEAQPVGEALNNLAYILNARGDAAGAVTHYRQAIAIWRKTLGPDSINTIRAESSLATALEASGDFAGARDAYAGVVERLRAARPADDPDLMSALVGEVSVLLRLGDASAAEPLVREALAVREKTLEAGDWRLSYTRGLLGVALAAQGRIDEAGPLLVASWDGLAAAPGAPVNRKQFIREQLASYYEAQGQTGKAAALR
ncbi:MAG: serine/threonine protein kinase [Acidobacteria bacterium]|nr:serine/threonine protein kinase [Acidobacteriota bacterium]